MTAPPFRYRQLAWLVSVALAGAGNAVAAPAGNVDFAIGGVSVTGADGRGRPATKGLALDSGDRIVTTDGRAQIRFTDGAYVSLQPNTDFSIRDYRYDGKTDGSERGIFGLVRGALRTVTGAIGRVNRSAYQIQTPTATIGIRGTGGLIQVLDDGTTRVRGFSGIWTVTNAGGTLDVGPRQAAVATPNTKQPPTETTEGPLVPAPPPGGPLEVALLRKPEGTALPFYTGTNDSFPDGFPPSGFTAATPVNENGIPLVIATGTPPFTQLPGTSSTQLPSGTYDALLQIGWGPYNISNSLTAQPVTFGSSGEALTIGPNAVNGGTVYEINNVSPIAWGRWTGPAVSVTYPGTMNVTQDQGVHYVVGIPTPTSLIPTTGMVPFTLVGATNPTFDAGTRVPGSFQNGQMMVDFSTARVGLQFNVVFSGPGAFTYAVQTTGGVANPSASQLAITGNTFTSTTVGVTTTPFGSGAPGCSTACQMTVSGGFFGPSAPDYAGFVYGSSASGVSGAAVFKK